MVTKNIYFAGAIVGDESYVRAQENIINLLRDCSGIDSEVRVYSERSPDYTPLSEENEENIFKRDLGWLRDSEAIVAEVSGESFGTGWEIAYAQKVQRIPILCLIQEDKEWPSLVGGNTHKRLWLGRYQTKGDLKNIFREFFSTVVDGEGCSTDGNLSCITQAPAITSPTPTEELWVGAIKKYELQGIALLDLKHNDFYTISKDCIQNISDNNIKMKELNSAPKLFREVTKSLTSARRGVLLAEASEPSTDVGWTTCLAQWNNVQPILFYQDDVDVSWLLIGQTEYVPREELISNQLDIPWNPPGFEPRGRPHHGTRPRAIPISYSNKGHLKSKLEAIFEKIDTKFSKREEIDHQESISAYSEGREYGDTVGDSTKDDLIIVAESLIRNAIWADVTVKGIENTFLSGERAKLITLLLDQGPFSGPKEYHANIQHLINYEEKAFAKNIRALKDIGILYKGRTRIVSNRSTSQKTLSDFVPSIDPPKSDQGSKLPEDYQASFTTDEVVLTPFGRDLAYYLQDHDEEVLDEFLQAHSTQLQEMNNVIALKEDIERYDGYLIEQLPDVGRKEIIGLVEANYTVGG